MQLRVRSRLPLVTLLPALVLAGCGTGPSPSATVSPLADAVIGVCQARAALRGSAPDTEAADRAFTNVAHEPLHILAADPGLERGLAARVLEAMEQVETDFEGNTDSDALEADLADLGSAAAAALDALRTEVPACAS